MMNTDVNNTNETSENNLSEDETPEASRLPGRPVVSHETRIPGDSRRVAPRKEAFTTVSIRVPLWQAQFIDEVSRLFGKPKSDFFRVALQIVVNRILEKYADRPEIVALQELVSRDTV